MQGVLADPEPLGQIEHKPFVPAQHGAIDLPRPTSRRPMTQQPTHDVLVEPRRTLGRAIPLGVQALGDRGE